MLKLNGSKLMFAQNKNLLVTGGLQLVSNFDVFDLQTDVRS